MRNSTVCRFEWKTLTYSVSSVGVLLHTAVVPCSTIYLVYHCGSHFCLNPMV